MAETNLEPCQLAHDLAQAMVKGWRIEMDCGPTIRAVQDRYTPHQETEWFYPDAVGEVRYVAPERFYEVAERLTLLALKAAGMCDGPEKDERL